MDRHVDRQTDGQACRKSDETDTEVQADADTQTKADTGTDTDRHRQAQTGTDRHRQTQTVRQGRQERHGHTQTDIIRPTKFFLLKFWQI